MRTTSVSLAVAPTVISTFLSHYLNRNALRDKPTASLAYDEGLHLIRAFLEYASCHTVEELQAFTAQWVPHPQWVKVVDATVPDALLDRAASLLQEQLGDDGLAKVGGRQWWQWRKPDAPLTAEWIEMRSDYNERKKTARESRDENANNNSGRGEKKSTDEGMRTGNRVMLYVHGGAYYFGSVDEHRYQMQRHARKLKARVFAPEYRLAPQFPFPCGLQDCLAAYLYLLETQAPETIVLAGDSAGGGMVVSMLVLLRDQGLPMPAGAVLISPWVDLTHSFPSVGGESQFDYIPAGGFHHKPSMAWPPPNDDEMEAIREAAKKMRAKKMAAGGSASSDAADGGSIKTALEGSPGERRAVEEDFRRHSASVARMLQIEIDGETVQLKDQIQMYTTNELLSHPLVSPILQPSLGGLPPLLIMVGGAEVLRDEQIFLAHKCANPTKYAPASPDNGDDGLAEDAKLGMGKYKPTPVQLQVWDDMCHVAPTLSFTRPAKYMYRSIAQFSAWALARAQGTSIRIPFDDAISVISTSGSDGEASEPRRGGGGEGEGDELKPAPSTETAGEPEVGEIGRAGDPLPPFRNHMIRQRVTRGGAVLPLPPESDLPGCSLRPGDIGVVKVAPVRRWLEARRAWDARYARAKTRAHRRLAEEMSAGYLEFGNGEVPPPSAIAGRRRAPGAKAEGRIRRKRKSLGLSLWSLWGSKHDKMAVGREVLAEKLAVGGATPGKGVEGSGGKASAPPIPGGMIRNVSKQRDVVDENQTGQRQGVGLEHEETLYEDLVRSRKESEAEKKELLGPDYVAETGVAGRRPTVDGIAVPFSLSRGAETASMATLQSEAVEDGDGLAQDVRPARCAKSGSEADGLCGMDDPRTRKEDGVVV